MTDGLARPKPDWNMIAVLVALFVQTCAIVWWASGINSRVASLEASAQGMEASTRAVAVLDERTVAIREGVARIERRLDREGVP